MVLSMTTLFFRVSTAVSDGPVAVASERKVLSRPPPCPEDVPTNAASTVGDEPFATVGLGMPKFMKICDEPTLSVLLDPGVFEGICAWPLEGLVQALPRIVAEQRPVKASFAQTPQPFE